MPVIYWIRRDLRLDDNPALRWACEQGSTVLPVYIHAPDEEAPWAPGAASRWWLHHSLAAMQSDLAARGSRLLILAGPSGPVLQRLIHQTGAQAVSWNRLYEPAAVSRDRQVANSLVEAGVEVHEGNALLLHEPWTVATGSGGPYRVFTPFWRRCQQESLEMAPDPAPRLPAAPETSESVPLAALGLCDGRPWQDRLAAQWVPGESGARARWDEFRADALAQYDAARDRPDQDATSRLSPHLHFGEISPRRVAAEARTSGDDQALRRFLAELGWREFAHHLLWHFPDTTSANFNPRFDHYPWREGAAAAAELERWSAGLTGEDFVDAGMGELWQRGWMHNRLRMITASYLTKNLGIHWREGARWFWDCLVDADLACNSLGWQWAAGSGADAAPFFRIFNPRTQAARFDPDGAYVRRWLPARPDGTAPLVDLGASRRAALDAYQKVREAG